MEGAPEVLAGLYQNETMQLKSKKKMKLFTFFLLFYENILIKHREDENLMYRKFISQLRQWEEANIKEPLLVIGARQVGRRG